MDPEITHHILCTQPKIAQALEAALHSHGGGPDAPAVQIHRDALDRADYDLIIGEDLQYPLRLGRLLDRLAKPALSKASRILTIGAATLDCRRCEWSKNGQKPQRLTEKEVQLLTLLYEAKGAPVGRDALLREVWEYAEDVESHTLETHIYRLRQKIEDDPANPSVLLTAENGYSVPR